MTRLKMVLICICALCCLALFSSTVQAAELRLAEGAATGQWYNPDRDGEGFFVEIIGEGDNIQISIAMYSYDEVGNQLWLVGNTPISGSATTANIPVVLIEGPVWGTGYDPDDRDTTQFGSIVARFPSCDSGLFNVESNVAGLESGSYSTVRLTEIVGMDCVDSPGGPPPDPPPTPEGGMTPGLWTGPGACFFVNEEGTHIVESDLCDNGKAVSLEAPGFEVDLDGKWDPDACQANAICNGAWEFNFSDTDATLTCINTLEGSVNLYCTSPTNCEVEGWQETGELNWCVGIVPNVTPGQ